MDDKLIIELAVDNDGQEFIDSLLRDNSEQIIFELDHADDIQKKSNATYYLWDRPAETPSVVKKVMEDVSEESFLLRFEDEEDNFWYAGKWLDNPFIPLTLEVNLNANDSMSNFVNQCREYLDDDKIETMLEGALNNLRNTSKSEVKLK